MKVSKSLFAIFIFATVFGCKSKVHMVDNKLNGMWKLNKIETLDNESGNWFYDSVFTGWTGYIIYDCNGHMGVQITPNGYKDFKANKNPDSLNNDGLKELVKFYKSNWVYFANYFIVENTLEHRRLSATEPKDWGTILTRDYEFREDTLILTAHETIGGKKSRLWWVKL